MRFKTDENIHPELAEYLRENGHDALTVWDQGMRGRPDSDLAIVCQAEQRALITLDLGFADIRAYPPQQFPGLVILRLVHQGRQSVMAVFPRVVNLLKSEPIEGRLWIVDEHRVRIREG
jgi:predicted nuclease of predicted toxin-antitoxin system